jgi:exopolysaccharide biosynthesis polyprenyl glycosylphosphotransferase
MITTPDGLADSTLDSAVLSSLDEHITGNAEHIRTETSSLKLKRTEIRRFFNASGTLDVGADFLAVTCSVLLAYYAYRFLHIGRLVHYSFSNVAAIACLGGLGFVLMMKANGAYTRAMSLLHVRDTERVLLATSKLCLFAFAVSFWSEISISRYVVLFAAVAIPLVVLSEQLLIHRLVRSVHARGYASRRTLIYGAGLSGRRTFTVLARSPKLGLDPVAVVDDEPDQIGKQLRESSYTSSQYLKVLAGPVTAEMLQALSIEVVIISSPSISAEMFSRISVETARAGATLSFVPHDAVTSNRPLSYWDADGLIFASIDDRELGGLPQYSKRVFDFAISVLLLTVLAPLMIFIAVVIHLTSNGPALFVQNRVGMNGRMFRMYKFRTMHNTSPQYAPSPTSSFDPRITRFGAFLRRTSLDEIPQLLNVMRGNMSLVGPRPEMPFIVNQYDELERQRLWVKPGITGLWQISADRAYQIHENIQYDLYYIRYRSFFMDLAILLHTIAFAMRGI